MRIAVNTGGGDAPGLNAALRAVTLSARRRGWDVLGITSGYQGLLDPDDAGLVPLDVDRVRGIGHLGGTILGSSNRGDPFRHPVRAQDGTLVASDVSGRVVERLRAVGVDALVAIGGDGSMRIAARLLACGVPRVIGVPKTIDNDLPGTDVTIGFETAVATATDALDRLHTTAHAHDRVLVVEVMGRNAGWIALHAGVAGGADVVLIPEIPFDLASVAAKIREREARGRHFSIVVVAEGARSRGGDVVLAAERDAFHEHARLGGIADRVAVALERETGKEARSLSLGHLLRGGSPVTFDRLLGTRVGAAATRFLAQTAESGLVAVRGPDVTLVSWATCTVAPRGVPLDSAVLIAARDLGISLGD